MPVLETECLIHSFYPFWSFLANSKGVFFEEPQIRCQARHRSEKIRPNIIYGKYRKDDKGKTISKISPVVK